MHIQQLSKTAYPEEGCGMMEPIPASTEQGAGYILDKLPVYHRVNANKKEKIRIFIAHVLYGMFVCINLYTQTVVKTSGSCAHLWAI